MKKIVFVLSIIILIVLINNLVRSIYDLWKKQDLITSAQKGLEAEKAENARLKRELTVADDPIFIEKAARDKLFLVQPGEAEVVLPNAASKAAARKSDTSPNWARWLKFLKF